jgi:hypothetical protein
MTGAFEGLRQDGHDDTQAQKCAFTAVQHIVAQLCTPVRNGRTCQEYGPTEPLKYMCAARQVACILALPVVQSTASSQPRSAMYRCTIQPP